MEMLAKITHRNGLRANVVINKVEYAEGESAIPTIQWGDPAKLYIDPDTGKGMLVPLHWDPSSLGEEVIVSKRVWDRTNFSWRRKRSRAVDLANQYFEGISALILDAQDGDVPSTLNYKEDRTPGVHVVKQRFIRSTGTVLRYRSYLAAEYVYRNRTRTVFPFFTTPGYDDQDTLFEDLFLARVALGDLLVREGVFESYDDLDWPRDKNGEVNVFVIDPPTSEPTPGGGTG